MFPATIQACRIYPSTGTPRRIVVGKLRLDPLGPDLHHVVQEEKVFVFALVVSSVFLSHYSVGSYHSLFDAAATIVDPFELFPAHSRCW